MLFRTAEPNTPDTPSVHIPADKKLERPKRGGPVGRPASVQCAGGRPYSEAYRRCRGHRTTPFPSAHPRAGSPAPPRTARYRGRVRIRTRSVLGPTTRMAIGQSHKQPFAHPRHLASGCRERWSEVAGAESIPARTIAHTAGAAHASPAPAAAIQPRPAASPGSRVATPYMPMGKTMLRRLVSYRSGTRCGTCRHRPRASSSGISRSSFGSTGSSRGPVPARPPAGAAARRPSTPCATERSRER